jgi:hypothetical protein
MPDLMTDHSNSASDEDQDISMDEGDCEMNGGTGPQIVLAQSGNDNGYQNGGQTGNYSFGSGGSGGFGFGPGAEEDEEILDVSSKEGQLTLSSGRNVLADRTAHYPSLALYPSITPHPNPHHITNQPAAHPGFGIARSNSPLSVQPFSSGLRSPSSMTTTRAGVFQPTLAAPLGENASDVERARAVHGPQCKSIPKLVMSEHADPITGQRSMWTVCGDCGSCERAG